VKAAGLVLATVLALAVQTLIGRLFGGGTGVDLVLVVVVFAALSYGPVTGLLTGTVAGLVQDAMATGIIGVGGLAKTVVGFIAGAIGTQFIVTHPLPRFVVFFGASATHTAIFIGIYLLLGAGDVDASWQRIAAQAVGNAIIGLLVFKVVDSVPGAVERRHAGSRVRR
jgi:rod shape-determining protein MreD